MEQRSVLLVDDDPDFRYMVRKALGSIGGFVIVEAGDGLEALQKYHHAGEEKFDIVLSDTHMPRMTGPVLRAELASLGYKGRFFLMSGLPAYASVEVDIVKPHLPQVLRSTLVVKLRVKKEASAMA